MCNDVVKKLLCAMAYSRKAAKLFIHLYTYVKTADALRVEGRRRRGRPRLRWEDCVKRDLAGVGVQWRMSARDGGVENEREGLQG